MSLLVQVGLKEPKTYWRFLTLAPIIFYVQTHTAGGQTCLDTLRHFMPLLYF